MENELNNPFQINESSDILCQANYLAGKIDLEPEDRWDCTEGEPSWTWDYDL